MRRFVTRWGGRGGIEAYPYDHYFLQCFDTVGWVIWPAKTVPEMTYNVFSGTLNPTHFTTSGLAFSYIGSVIARHSSNGRKKTWHLIYIFEGSCPLTEFCHVQNALCILVLRSPMLAALLHGTRIVGINQFAALSRGRHLYSVGRPSRWALAHILVLLFSSPILSGRKVDVYHTSIPVHDVALMRI